MFASKARAYQKEHLKGAPQFVKVFAPTQKH